jgi:AraC-like DNA-binding protein
VASFNRPEPGWVEFSTDAVCAADRFDFWRNLFGAVHSVEVEREQRPGFAAKGCTWRLGPVLVGQFDTPARRIIRDRHQVRQDDLDHIVLRVTADWPDQRPDRSSNCRTQRWQLGISSYTHAYEQALPGGPWVTAILDRGAFPEFRSWSGVPQMLHGTSAAMLAGFLVSLPDALRSMQGDEEPQVTQAVCAMISACIAGALNLRQSKAEDSATCLRLKVEQIIAANLPSPRLTPGRIAELAGVSRSTLYRAFELEGGIAQHILQRRLSQVRRDLETPSLAGLSIAEVGERQGLHNAASFHRAFRQHIGETPGDYRARSLGGRRCLSAERPAAGEAGAPSFMDLLRARPS